MRRLRPQIALGLLVLTALMAPLASPAQSPARSPAPSPAPSSDHPASRPRLIMLKIDGLSPQILNALIFPDDPAMLARLPDPEGYRRAIELYRAETGRQEVIPNIRRYFYDRGVRMENMVAATVTLSSISWGVIETGQPSVVKRHMSYSRQSGYLRSHLDGFRDTFNIVMHSARKTNAVWQLDQAGVSLFSDAFHPERTYITPWMYYRQTPQSYLTSLGKHWLTNGERGPWGITKSHLARRMGDINYPEWQEQFVARHIAQKILERDFAGQERFDLISTFFTIDHQYHVDPNPENIVHRLARIDRRIGIILNAVERSQRRDHTLVTIVSDHGSEYATGTVNLSFPITRMFRTRFLGGHTVASVMVEDSAHALSTPMQGIDFPRILEGKYSPYNKGPGAQGDYSTAFIDNFGNARSEVHLRNNDLNRLHLLLLARLRKLNNDEKAMLREKMETTLASIRRWLEPDYAAYRDYYDGARAWLPFLKKHADSYWRDVGNRLKGENKRDAKQLRTLARLLKLTKAEDPIAWLDKNTDHIPRLIPKKYFGPRNSVYQLSHYTLNLDDGLNWVETTVDPRGRAVPMDYFRVLSDFDAPNPPQSYERNPTDLIVTALPVEPVTEALRERGWLPPSVTLRQASWLLSTTREKLTRAGQALILQTTEGLVRYLPIRNLAQSKDGQFSFEPANDLDPLGLFYDPKFQSADGRPAYLWLKDFHTYNEWVKASYATHYTIAPLVIMDICGQNALPFINNPEVQQTIEGFPDEASKQQYLRGLRWKYAAQEPDLLLWSSYLWNYSSKSHTAGGSHGGLPPHVANTSFLLWGGKNINLPQGKAVLEPATTLDVVPTLAQVLGMLGEDGRVIRRAGSYHHRPLLPLPGHPLVKPPDKPLPAKSVAGSDTLPQN